jgi:GlpG protein
MRKLANFDTVETAQKLNEILYAHEVDGEVRGNEDGSFSIWIHSEDQLEKARAIFDSFRENPLQPEYRQLIGQAQIKRKEKATQEKQLRRKNADVRLTWRATTSRGPLTITVIIICVGIAAITELGDKAGIIRYLTITDFVTSGGLMRHLGWASIESGQVWRLFTPALLHFSFIHIFFNMWWLYDLGSAIENRKSSWYLGLLILVVAGISNVAQFMASPNPLFGGMSGVVYGLLGYIWMIGKFKPSVGLFAPKPIVTFMLAWLALGFTGFFGLFGVGIANVVHLAGLIAGALWGYLESGDFKRRMRR